MSSAYPMGDAILSVEQLPRLSNIILDKNLIFSSQPLQRPKAGFGMYLTMPISPSAQLW